MSSIIQISVKGLEEMLKKLDAEEANIVKALAKANVKAGTEAVNKLVRGLDDRHGEERKDPNYQTSPKGSLPYGHTMKLRDSIGFQLLAHGNKITGRVGSGGNDGIPGVPYAKFLEGTNGNGIRPFLWYIKDIYNADKIKEYFDKYYKPLSGDK